MLKLICLPGLLLYTGKFHLVYLKYAIFVKGQHEKCFYHSLEIKFLFHVPLFSFIGLIQEAEQNLVNYQ